MMTRTMPRIALLAIAISGCASVAERVVLRQLDAYNAHDLEAFAGTYSDDVLITSADGKVLVLGKEGLRERYGKAFAKFPRTHATISESKVEGNVVRHHEIIRGRPDKPDPWDAGWVRYEVRDGLIQSVQFEQ
jgi:hypothetical protein